MSFLTICLNPVIQKTFCFSSVLPGAVNRTVDHRLDVSGKGINVTRVLTQLGKKTVHLTQLGGVMRPLFLSLCEKDGLSVEWVESESQIRFCYTILTECDNEVTELVEEAEPVADGTEKRLLEKYNSLIDMNIFSFLIISGTKAAGFSDTLIPKIVQKAKDKGLKVILDIKAKDLINSLQYKPDIIKPNLEEFLSTFMPELIKKNQNKQDMIKEDYNISIIEKIKSTVLDINKKYGCHIILTNGGKNIFYTDSNDICEYEISEVKAVNTTGCGDAFTAGLASSLEAGTDFKDAITEGIRCGALNAQFLKPGTINNSCYAKIRKKI